MFYEIGLSIINLDCIISIYTRDLTNDYVIMFETPTGAKYIKHFNLCKEERDREYINLKTKLCND